ncbi:hypothetical protein FB45DRAFT_1008432 [Roridomyces roridus]|uniref:Uncharacterized protein n=1 Tax=Roridomyces roridus TaxID=1738132 RepID=A0AAD7BBA2_9AGAR|nr:hypothetical protein FB45DRAFT_1008432 [Roridomyces roridus]
MNANAPSINYDAKSVIELEGTGSAGFAGSFFPQSRHLRVTGGTYTSHVHFHQLEGVQDQPEEFKQLGRWEINLRREILPRATVRRVFSAKIRNEDLPHSVILFEGANSEAESRQYISRHADLWHPNLLQIFGVSNFSGKHAVIAQDGLVVLPRSGLVRFGAKFLEPRTAPESSTIIVKPTHHTMPSHTIELSPSRRSLLLPTPPSQDGNSDHRLPRLASPGWRHFDVHHPCQPTADGADDAGHHPWLLAEGSALDLGDPELRIREGSNRFGAGSTAPLEPHPVFGSGFAQVRRGSEPDHGITNAELVPFTEYLDLHRPSTIRRIYLHALWCSEINHVKFFLRERVKGISLTHWIRRSTGQICVDLARNPGIKEISVLPHFDIKYIGSASDEVALEALSMRSEVHATVWMELDNHFSWFKVHVGLDKPLDRLGAIFRPGNDVGVGIVVAYLPEISLNYGTWRCRDMSVEVLENGWTRLDGHQSHGKRVSLSQWSGIPAQDAWMSQANHIFKQLRITSHFLDYVYIDNRELHLRIASSGTKAPPNGYLFLCPPDHLRFQLPECLWFWSLDPNGQPRLSADEANSHGFPAVHMEMDVSGQSWDAGVYVALREFHAAKGFDPHSQELAIHMGVPLYQLSGPREETFAYVSETRLGGGSVTSSVQEERVPEALNTALANPEETIPASVVPPLVVSDESPLQGGLLASLFSWETPEFGSFTVRPGAHENHVPQYPPIHVRIA